MRPTGVLLACLGVLVALPAVAQAGDQWTFRQPRARPTDHPDPARHSYSLPEAPKSPACAGRFCVHWVAEGIDAPDLADENGFQDGDGVPDYVEQVLKVGAHVHAVENGRLGWREPRSDGRRGGSQGKTDIYLKELGRLLFGYAAPDRGQVAEGAPPAAPHARLPRARQRLRPLPVPGDQAARRPRGHLRPRVLPHPADELRRLPGRLDGRVDRGLDGGPGLQRDQRLPALRAPLGPPLQDAADRQLDPRVRRDGLERMAGPALRARDPARRLVARPAHASRRLLRRQLRLGDPRRRRLGLQPRLRPLRPRRRRVARRRPLPRRRPLSRRSARRQPARRRQAAAALAQPRHLPAAAGTRERRARRRRPGRCPARGRRRAGFGRPDRQRAPRARGLAPALPAARAGR